MTFLKAQSIIVEGLDFGLPVRQQKQGQNYELRYY